MIRLLIPCFLLAFAHCTNKATVGPATDVLEIEAQLLGDKLPIDGCGAHLWLNFVSPSSASGTYMRLPTAATRLLMDKVIQAEVAKQPVGTFWMGSKDVTISYRETGQTASLQCGWGAAQTIKTIDLLSIKDR